MDTSILNIELFPKEEVSETTAGKVLKKSYRENLRYLNTTSYSTLLTLHECPRKFELAKVRLAAESKLEEIPNIHFVFGHSVGAGIQEYLKTRNPERAIFAGLLAWNAPLDLTEDRSKKSSVFATLAIQKFIFFWEQNFHEEYELFYFIDASGTRRPGIELAASVDFSNTYRHYAHIDVVLVHRPTARLVVLELKTTGSSFVDAASYANSSQALGYSVILDKIAQGQCAVADYEVIYLVYNTKSREFTVLPFVKSRTAKAEWLQDVLLDHANIMTYAELRYFPRRGESCISFNRRCQFFGTCDMKMHGSATDLARLEGTEEGEVVDFHFTLEELIGAQK